MNTFKYIYIGYNQKDKTKQKKKTDHCKNNIVLLIRSETKNASEVFIFLTLFIIILGFDSDRKKIKNVSICNSIEFLD